MNYYTIYKKCSKWVQKNINFFDPNILRQNVDSDLMIKSYVELIFMRNMFYPDKVYSKDTIASMDKLIIKTSKKINFNTYFLFDHYLISGSEVLCELAENNTQLNVIDKKMFKKLISSNLDVLPRRTPYRQLDVDYSLRKIKISSNFPSFKDLYNNTILAKAPNLFYLSNDLAYSITHTLFYITDMGRKKLSKEQQNTYQILLKKLITFYILEGNMDLLSECIICLCFIYNFRLPSEQEELIQAAFQTIQKNQMRNGIIIAPGESKQTLKNNSDEELFYKSYHTVLVTMGATFAYGKSTNL